MFTVVAVLCMLTGPKTECKPVVLHGVEAVSQDACEGAVEALAKDPKNLAKNIVGKAEKVVPLVVLCVRSAEA